MDESGRIDPQPRGLNLVDVSSENNAHIVASSSSTSALGDHQSIENQSNDKSSELLEAIAAEKVVDTVDFDNQALQMAQPSETLEPERQMAQPSETLEPERTRKNGKCNLRQSLAWDTAFFTSAGVLDPDELSSIIGGIESGAKHFLPGIEEDIQRSIDSISTLESESLESLEAELFEDIRASIQKSNKASSMESSSEAASGEKETQVTCSSKKMDFASNNMIKQKPASKKQNIGIQGPGKLTKQRSGYSQGTQTLARNGHPISSIQKAPNVIGRPTPISSASLKRASLTANRVKLEDANAKSASVSGKVATVSKLSGLGASSRALPKSSSKSSTPTSSTTTKEEPANSSSPSGSRSASSANVGTTSVRSTRRNIDSRTINPTSSSSILKTPSKVALKKKGQSGLSAHLMSSKLSSNVSSASSISEGSSESSSSTSNVNQRSSTSRASIGSDSSRSSTSRTSIGRSLDNDAASAKNHLHQPNDQTSNRRETKATRLPNENAKPTSTQIGTRSQPATVKPSGLRMPSPKIGFFDGVKPVVRTPKGSVQSYSGRPAGPEFGPGICSPSGALSKPNPSRIQPAKVVTANTKHDTQKPQPLASPVSSKKISNVCRGVKNSPSSSPRVQNKTHSESCLKPEEVPREPNRASDFSNTGLDSAKTGSILVLKSNTNLEVKDVKSAPTEGDTHASRPHCDGENKKLTEEVYEEAICGFEHLKHNSPSLGKGNEKDNANAEDQVDGLSVHVGGAGDSKQELTGNSISQTDSSHPGSEKTESNLPEPIQTSRSSVDSGLAASTRTPFTVKNAEGFDPSPRSKKWSGEDNVFDREQLKHHCAAQFN